MIEVNLTHSGITEEALAEAAASRSDELDRISEFAGIPADASGWVAPESLCTEAELRRIEEEAARLRELGDMIVLIGVGGSNGAARAVAHACQATQDPREIVYMGDTLSASALQQDLLRIQGRRPVVIVIAKNFATLEPGLSFRLVRDQLERELGTIEMPSRIVCIGTPGDCLETLAGDGGFSFFPFPESVGGRFSALSEVSLLPLAVAGFDLRELRTGAIREMEAIRKAGVDAPPWRYALARQILAARGFDTEIMAFFEPTMEGLGLWWRQLFGESEGKAGKGIFPALCSYSEDLHSMGQYVQEGPRRFFETFLTLSSEPDDLPVPLSRLEDGLNYLNGQSVAQVNRAAESATLRAHTAGGVPCLTLELGDRSASALGAAFSFFMSACFASATFTGVNPFDQPGVEAYKQRMTHALRTTN